MTEKKCRVCGRIIPYGHVCLSCGDYDDQQRFAADKPKTNGDRIRQMTDEELAKLLCLVKDKLCFACAYTRIEDCTGISCENARLEWLRKEVSEHAPD